MFGIEPPSQTFIERMGDLVILPFKDEAVWWYEKNRFEVGFLGMHGGLEEEELDIPFIVYKKG